MSELTHIDARGEARMVDVSVKAVLLREAIARGEIHVRPETLQAIESQAITKGNVLATARIAGIFAAKKRVNSSRCATHCRSLIVMSISMCRRRVIESSSPQKFA